MCPSAHTARIPTPGRSPRPPSTLQHTRYHSTCGRTRSLRENFASRHSGSSHIRVVSRHCVHRSSACPRPPPTLASPVVMGTLASTARTETREAREALSPAAAPCVVLCGADFEMVPSPAASCSCRCMCTTVLGCASGIAAGYRRARCRRKEPRHKKTCEFCAVSYVTVTLDRSPLSGPAQVGNSHNRSTDNNREKTR